MVFRKRYCRLWNFCITLLRLFRNPAADPDCPSHTSLNLHRRSLGPAVSYGLRFEYLSQGPAIILNFQALYGRFIHTEDDPLLAKLVQRRPSPCFPLFIPRLGSSVPTDYWILLNPIQLASSEFPLAVFRRSSRRNKLSTLYSTRQAG